MELLLKHPDLQLHIVPQWPWGSSAIKPTGLVALRLPWFLKDLYARRPSNPAIGKHSDGSFKTAAHKEYPEGLCRALAAAIIRPMTTECRAGRFSPSAVNLTPDTSSWLEIAKTDSAVIREHAQWLPDFQG